LAKPDAVRFRGVDGIAEINQLRRFAQPDDPRQQIERPHIRARETNLHEQKGGARLIAKDPQIGREHEHRTRSRGDAIDGGDDRLLEFAHIFDDVAGHAREVVQLVTFHLEQRADDVGDAAAGTKTFAGAGQDDNFDLIVARQIEKNLFEIAVRLKRQRIEFVRIVEPNGSDTVGVFENKTTVRHVVDLPERILRGSSG
jgi:hypothetical protein